MRFKELLELLICSDTVLVKEWKYDLLTSRLDVKFKLPYWLEFAETYISMREMIELAFRENRIEGDDRLNNQVKVNDEWKPFRHWWQDLEDQEAFVRLALDGQFRGAEDVLKKIEVQGDACHFVPEMRYGDLSILQKQAVLWRLRDSSRLNPDVPKWITTTWWYIEGQVDDSFMFKMPPERFIEAIYLKRHFTLLNYSRRFEMERHRPSPFMETPQ